MILERIMEIEQESFLSPWNEESYREMLNDERYTFFFENIDGEIAAFAVSLDMYDIDEIIKIAVDKKYRRRGLASLLMDKIIENARQRKKSAVWLEVRKSNIEAISLYNKKKFEIVSIRKKYYQDSGENALVMRLNLE